MAEKILNTRIQLKYDTLEKWNSSTGILKAGEVAIATVPAGSAGQEVGSVTTPQVLVKIGDGKNTFANLPYITAKAGDVYAWAKAEKLGKDAFSAEVQKLFTDIENDITALEGKVGTTNVADQIATAVNAAIEGLDVTDAAVANQFVVAVPQTDGKVAVERRVLAAADIPELAQEKITGLTTKLSNIDTEIAGIKNTETGILAEAKKYTDDEVAKLADGAVKDNTDAIAVINDETTGILATAKGYTDTEVGNAKTAAATDAQDKANKALADAKDYVDAEIAKVTGDGEGSLGELEGRVAANEDAIAVINGADTVEGSLAKVAKEAAADVAAEELRATNAETALSGRLDQVEIFFHFASEEEKNEAYDTLKEIQDYIEGDASAAAQLTAKVNQNTAAIGFGEDDFENGAPKKTLVALIEEAEGRVAEAVTNEETRAKGEEARIEGLANTAQGTANQAVQDAAAAQGTADDALEAIGAKTDVATDETVYGAIATEKARAEDEEGKLNTAITNEVTNRETAVNAVKAEIGVDAQGNYIELTGEHTTLIAAINAANAGVSANADEIGDIKEQLAEITGDEGILGAANAYTDAEIVKVNNTITTLNGEVVKTVEGDDVIKASIANNKLTIDFDDTLTFVFNCGTSANLDPAQV